jgi:malonyl-CoA O-methyltransferase
MTRIDRQRVRQAFSSQAGAYDRYARVQKRVVVRLIEQLAAARLAPGAVLDVGAGTGQLLARLQELYPLSRLAGVDLAVGMAATAARQLGAERGGALVCADAEQLPFVAGAFELVVSTSTYQWLASLEQAFSEAWRVLAPGGRFLFALFGDRTLWELKDAYRQALAGTASPLPDRTHRSFTVESVSHSLREAGFRGCQSWAELEIEEHPDVAELLRSLKRIGAGNAAPPPATGLAGRRLMSAMMENYRRDHGRNGLIPATYEVIYGVGTKEERG